MKVKNTIKLTLWVFLTVLALSCTKEDSDGPSTTGGGGISGGGIGGIGGGTGGGDTGGGGTGGGGTGGGTGGSGKTQTLTAKDWKAVAIHIDPGVYVNGQPVTDLTPFYDPCELDDVSRYKADFTYEFNEGATKCDPNAPQIQESGTWAWANNESQITHTTQGQSYSVNVDALTATQLTMSYTTQLQYNDGTTGTHKFTLIYN